MSIITSKAKAAWHIAASLKPRTTLMIGAGLVIVGSGIGFAAAQSSEPVATENKPAITTKPQQDKPVAQVEGAVTEAPAEQPAVAAQPAPKQSKPAAQPAPKQSKTLPIIDPKTLKRWTPPAPTPTPTPTPAVQFSVNGPRVVEIARGSSATIMYTSSSNAAWMPMYKNVIFSDGYSESPNAPYQLVLPFASTTQYHGNSITVTITVSATATPGTNNEVALYLESDTGDGMAMSTKVTIL